MLSDDITPFTNHLEFLGYECDTEDVEDWSTACHPSEYNFFYRNLPHGTRLHAEVNIGIVPDDRRGEFLEWANDLNERSILAKFSLWKRHDDRTILRIRAMFTSEYEKVRFGAFIKQWQLDTQVNNWPDLPEEEEPPVDDEESSGTS